MVSLYWRNRGTMTGNANEAAWPVPQLQPEGQSRVSGKMPAT